MQCSRNIEDENIMQLEWTTPVSKWTPPVYLRAMLARQSGLRTRHRKRVRRIHLFAVVWPRILVLWSAVCKMHRILFEHRRKSTKI